MPKLKELKPRYMERDIGIKINEAMSRKKISFQELADELGMTRQGLRYKLDNNGLKYTDLLIIFKHLGLNNREIINLMRIEPVNYTEAADAFYETYEEYRHTFNLKHHIYTSVYDYNRLEIWQCLSIKNEGKIVDIEAETPDQLYRQGEYQLRRFFQIFPEGITKA